MKLQRPITAQLYCWGHNWPVELRVKPRSKARIFAEYPTNDNGWKRGPGDWLRMRRYFRCFQLELFTRE